MFFHKAIRWILLLWILALISACGGGGSEPSKLLSDTAQPVDTSTPTTPTDTTTKSIYPELSVQQIVPAAGTSTVRLLTFVDANPTKDSTGKNVVAAPHIPFIVSVTEPGVLTNVPTETNDNGEATFNVSHPSSGNVLVTLKATGNYVGGFNFPIYFGASFTATVSQGIVPADGTTAATLDVFARDWSGVPITGVPVELSFPIGSFATAAAISGGTNEKGIFNTTITNTVAQATAVTPIVGGMIGSKLPLVFGTTGVSTTVSTLDLIIKNNNVPADNKTNATVVVVARDGAGTPIPNVPVSITSDSGTATLSIGDNTRTLFISGNTGNEGSFEINLKNTVEETVTLTAKTSDGKGGMLEKGQAVVFKNPEATVTPNTPEKKIKIELDSPTSSTDPAKANGRDTITISGKVSYEDSSPVVGTTVSIIVSGGSAKQNLVNGGKTNSAGLFYASFTDTVVETFSVRAVVGGVSSSLVTLKFTAIPEVTPTEPTAVIPQPQSVTLVATPAIQKVDGEITLTAIARDASNTPMEGITVSVSTSGGPNANMAVFDKAIDKTGAGGTVTFKLKNSMEGIFTVTAVAKALDSKGTTVGNPVTATQTVEFTAVDTDPGVNYDNLRLTVTIADRQGVPSSKIDTNGKPQDGKAVRIDAVVRDRNGQPVGDVPIIVQLSSRAAVLADPAKGKTNANGYFSTSISSTVAGEVNVTIAIEGSQVVHSGEIINFAAQSVETGSVLKTVELQVMNSPQLADGTAKITLVVIPRNTQGAPVTDLDVELISDSNNIQIAAGKTNSLGEYRTTVSSKVAEVVHVTPVAKSKDIVVQGTPVAIEFTPTGVNVADLTVTVVDNNQTVGKPITVAVVARDSSGKPVADSPIIVKLPTSSVAFANPSQGLTDANGFFKTEINSSQSGEVAVTIAISGTTIAAPPVIAKFLAASGTAPVRVDLQVLDAPKPADGTSKITLVVTPRDAKGAPIAGVKIQFVSESEEVKPAEGETNALGEYRTSIASKVAGTFNITAVAAGVPGQKVPVTFTPVATPIPATLALTFDKNSVKVGESIKLTVLARDDKGFAMGSVPVTLLAVTGETPPDTSGSATFTPFKGTTNAESGTFGSEVKNTQAGTFKVRAVVEGTTLSSNEISLTFTGDETTQKPPVASLELFTSSPELPSEGKEEGVIITARLKDEKNNLISGTKVSFSADSGAIQPVSRKINEGVASYEVDNDSGTTDSIGQAYARLTTINDTNNRTITVTATVENKTVTIKINTVGTKITFVSRPDAIVLNTQTDLTIKLADSSGKGISGQTLSVTSAKGNILSNTAPVTDSNGQVIVKLTASVAGQDTITATKSGATQDTLTISISEDNFTITSNGVPNAEGLVEIPIGATQGSTCLPPYINCQPTSTQGTKFTIHWDKAGVPQVGETIRITTTRGSVNPSTGTTNDAGNLVFSVSADNVGPAVITASTSRAGGPTKQITILFIAAEARSMTIQASPATIGVNANGKNDQKSEIVVVLRDSSGQGGGNAGNLVKGKRVNFTLSDTTGGRIDPAYAITDSAGEARTVYFAGASPSSSGGIIISASVEGTSNIYCVDGVQSSANQCSVKITVALKQAFITLGTGNTIEERNQATYAKPYTALVTDINGAPVQDAQVVLSIIPTRYAKGTYKKVEKWAQVVYTSCSSEDINRNGLLDAGEDINGDTMLTPSNVATFEATTDSVIEGNRMTVKTDKGGFANFNILYPKNYGSWVEVELTAKTQSSGSEDQSKLTFILEIAAKDIEGTPPPPGTPSPFGIGATIDNKGTDDPTDDVIVKPAVCTDTN